MIKGVSILYLVSSIKQSISKYTKYCKPKGFTLVEILVVITVLSIISSIGYINFNVALNKGRDAKRKQDLKAVRTALVSYYQDYGEYPCTPTPCTADTEFSSETADWIPNLAPNYIKSLPKDPRQAGFVSRLAGLLPKFGGGTSPQPQVAATSTVEIPANFDGRNSNPSSCSNSETSLYFGNTGGVNMRVWLRFPLSSLPANATINDVKLKLSISTAIGGGSTADVQAYNQNGQADPNLDSCATKISRTANDSFPYLNNTTNLKTTGAKILQLPAAADTDVQNAKSAVNYFSMGINEDTTAVESYSAMYSIEGGIPAKLAITYTVPDPTPTPAPTPTPTPTPTPSPSPDLGLTNVVLKSNNTCNGSAVYSFTDGATIYLCADYTVTGSILSWFSEGYRNQASQPPYGTAGQSQVGTSVAPGSYTNLFSGSFTASVATCTNCTAALFLDYDNSITESNEANNFQPFTYTVIAPTPTPTPTPLPSATPVATPPPLVGPCDNKDNFYCYRVSADRLYFILWAKLDNTGDGETIDKAGVFCTGIDGSGRNWKPQGNWNYCLESPK